MNRFQKLLAAMVVSGVCLGAGVNGAAAATNAPVKAAAPSLAKVSPDAAPALTYNARYLLKLYQSGLNEDTLLSYINSAQDPYSLNAQAVAYFQTAGVPAVIAGGVDNGPVWGGFSWGWGNPGGFRPDGFRRGTFGGGFHPGGFGGHGGFGHGGGSHGGGSGGHGGGHR